MDPGLIFKSPIPAAAGARLRWGVAAVLVIAFYADFALNIASERYLYLARAIAEHGELHLNSVLPGPQGDLAFRDGKYYCGAAPGMGMLMAPPAWVAARAGIPPSFRNLSVQVASTVLINGLATVMLLMIWTRLLVASGTVLSRALVVAGLGLFGTHYFFYAIRVTEYPVVLLLQSLVIMEAFGANRSRVASAFRSGVCIGFLSLLNAIGFYTALVFWCCRHLSRKRLLEVAGLAVGGAAPFGLKLAYNWHCFGSPWASSYSFSLFGVPPSAAAEFIAGRISILEAVVWMAREFPVILLGSTFGPIRGVFTTSPILLLPFLGMYLARTRPTRLELAALAAMAANVAILCTFTSGVWEGGPGVGWGQRYLLPSLPMLGLFWLRVEREGGFPGSRFWRTAVVWLAAVSMLFNWIAAQYSHSSGIHHHLKLFLIGGPTSSAFRRLWLQWPRLEGFIARRALVDENMTGYFYALTNPSPFVFNLLLLIALLLLIGPEIRDCFRAGRAEGGLNGLKPRATSS